MTRDRRKLQFESLILRAVQERMARGLADPRVRGLVTITRLELSDDHKRAKAFVSVMPDEHAELTMHGLNAAAGRIRKDVMGKIHIKDMPSIEFAYDHGLKSQLEVMALLARERLDKEAQPPRPPDTNDETNRNTDITTENAP